MDDLSFARRFRLRPGGIECDAEGLRVGGIALLARDTKGAWRRRDERDLSRELSELYGFPVEIERKRKGVEAVAAALAKGELARAQIAALLLQLPDPPPSSGLHPDGMRKRRLVADLDACGLLKADADWEEKHPRTGTPPNPGWFAPTSEAPAADGPKSGPESGPAAHTPSGAALAYVAPGPAVEADSVLAEGLSETALRGLATLAARLSAATILFDAIFVPSDNGLVEEGRIPGRPDVAYRWAHDETETAVTLKVLIEGEWRTLAVGKPGPNGLVYDRNGRAVVRVVDAPGRRPSLVATVEALDRAVADLSGEDGAPTNDDRGPKLCPRPKKEAKTNNSANAVAYQEYVSGLPYPWAIRLGETWFDGCDPRTGDMLDAKANMDFLFDSNDSLKVWVKGEKNPANQMQRQSRVVTAAGRAVVWHAQTEKTYRGLKQIADDKNFLNLSVIYDPNWKGGPR
jgi:hypothetical protein